MRAGSWPRLYAVVDVAVAAAHRRDPVSLAQAYLDGGARCLQLRARGIELGQLLEWSRAIVEAAERVGARVIINDRSDLTLMADAAGVHLGQDDLPVDAARRLLGPDRLIGRSTHDEEQVARALEDDVDYIAIGPVFATATKETGYAPVGLDAVRRTRAQAGQTPVVAIGGISLDTAPAVIAAGATSVAVISDLMRDGEPVERVRDYVDVLDRTPAP